MGGEWGGPAGETVLRTRSHAALPLLTTSSPRLPLQGLGHQQDRLGPTPVPLDWARVEVVAGDGARGLDWNPWLITNVVCGGRHSGILVSEGWD